MSKQQERVCLCVYVCVCVAGSCNREEYQYAFETGLICKPALAEK